MGNWFNGLDLGVKYAIALSGLFVLVMCFACTKLYLMKRKQKKWVKEHANDSEEAGKTERAALNQQEEGEGDLFGIRALEKGFTGGVAQSRPATPSLASGSRSNSTLALSGHIPYGRTASASSSTTMIVDSETISKISTVPKSAYVAKGALKMDPAVDMALNVPESPRGLRPQETSVGHGSYTSNPGTPLLGPSFTSPELFQGAISPRIQSVTSSSPVMHRSHSGTPSIVSEHHLSRSNTPDIRGEGSPSPPLRVYSPQISSRMPTELYDGPNGKRTRSPTEGTSYLDADRITHENSRNAKNSGPIPSEIDDAYSAKPREPSWPLPEDNDPPSSWSRKLKARA